MTVTLASISLDVSNLYRNGKYLSYKKGWKSVNLSEEDVFQKFDAKVIECFGEDIARLKEQRSLINSNMKYLHNYQ